ncbi:hypothetical protein PAJ34TS1_31460 [Paenibacillus azoreducens]
MEVLFSIWFLWHIIVMTVMDCCMNGTKETRLPASFSTFYFPCGSVYLFLEKNEENIAGGG